MKILWKVYLLNIMSIVQTVEMLFKISCFTRKPLVLQLCCDWLTLSSRSKLPKPLCECTWAKISPKIKVWRLLMKNWWWQCPFWICFKVLAPKSKWAILMIMIYKETKRVRMWVYQSSVQSIVAAQETQTRQRRATEQTPPTTSYRKTMIITENIWLS